MMGRTALVVAACAVLASGAGCIRRGKRAAPRQPVLVEIEVQDGTAAAERPAPLDLAAVRAEAVRLQRAANVFRVELGRKPHAGEEAWRMRIELALAESAREGKGLARAAIMVQLERIGGPLDAPRLESQGGAEVAYDLGTPDPGAVYANLVKRALGDIMKGLTTRVRLRRATGPELAAALEDREPETRLAAVAAAAERRDRAAVPALIKRLSDPVDAVRDRALGALVEIGDRRAVKPLTETKFQDVETMRKVVDAIGSLGGGEARSYLEFVASGHEDPDIRLLAKEALERMLRKERRRR